MQQFFQELSGYWSRGGNTDQMISFWDMTLRVANLSYSVLFTQSNAFCLKVSEKPYNAVVVNLMGDQSYKTVRVWLH